MKICYTPKNFRDAALLKIEQANDIIADSKSKGYDLSLRQLYYQFVARDIIANNMKEYKNLQSVINDARLAGLISWKAIEDRTRELNDYYYAAIQTPDEVLEDAVAGIVIDRWETQPYYCEVWVEKDALINVLERPCRALRVPYYATKGNNSQSEQHAAGQRFIEKIQNGKSVVLFHLADHDPTGIDMTRDNLERLEMFIQHETDCNFEVRRLALNMDQIRKYKPPHNPAKTTDSRYAGYVRATGTDKSWELDALKPEVIDALIRENIKSLIDDEEWAATKQREEDEKETFRAAAKVLKGE